MNTTNELNREGKPGRIMQSAFALCPSDLPHTERMGWIAAYFTEHYALPEAAPAERVEAVAVVNSEGDTLKLSRRLPIGTNLYIITPSANTAQPSAPAALEDALRVLADIRKDVRSTKFGGLQCDELERQIRAVAASAPMAVEATEQHRPFRCIKPQCPVDCSGCNHAVSGHDEARVLIADMLDAFAIDGMGGVYEDGESAICDRARAYLWRANAEFQAPGVVVKLPHGELDVRSAIDQARKMKSYVDAFNGQSWSPAFDSVDRQNLATALDNLQETAAMLANVSERLASHAAPAVAAGSIDPWKCYRCDGENHDCVSKAQGCDMMPSTHPSPAAPVQEQAKALTEEQIIELTRADCESFRWPSTAITIARAIEEAHGITQPKPGAGGKDAG